MTSPKELRPIVARLDGLEKRLDAIDVELDKVHQVVLGR